MSLAEDLLDQARALLNLEAKRPKQASLRRAISTAYYSLFHLIIADASTFLVGTRLAPQVARSFEHKSVRSAAVAVGDFARRGQPNHWMASLLNRPIANELLEVCDSFNDLQEHRHRADYDTAARFTRLQATDLVSRADSAHACWRTVRETHNARVFIAASAKLISQR